VWFTEYGSWSLTVTLDLFLWCADIVFGATGLEGCETARTPRASLPMPTDGDGRPVGAPASGPAASRAGHPGCPA
jgi:hypothetical protein